MKTLARQTTLSVNFEVCFPTNAYRMRFESPGDRLGKGAPRCSGRGAGSNFYGKYPWICTLRVETKLIQKSSIRFCDISQLILKFLDVGFPSGAQFWRPLSHIILKFVGL